jgi:dTDP-4-amino-4,6-dideoxygalactose transaminase
MNRDIHAREDRSVYVTRAMLPDLPAYEEYLEQIFSSRRLTNHGDCVCRLEAALTARLRVPCFDLCSNGTLALQLGLRVSGLAGREVITTPFSYVATVSALLWEGCTPVFADIDEETLCLDPASVAERLTPQTAGLVPVHIYGNICDVDALSAIADANGLRVLYDAAQAFGSEFCGHSVLDYGDYAACSFHATKVFHTVEGGGLVTRAREDHEAFTLLRACGHRGDNHIRPGLNAKLSEVHAAMGLSLLDNVADNIAGRKRISHMYDDRLPVQGGLRRPMLRPGLTYNYAHYPMIFDDETILLRVVERLNREDIFPRRYFFPSLNTLPYLKTTQPCPVAESVARRVLCLPLYAEMEEAVVEKISKIVHRSL